MSLTERVHAESVEWCQALSGDGDCLVETIDEPDRIVSVMAIPGHSVVICAASRDLLMQGVPWKACMADSTVWLSIHGVVVLMKVLAVAFFRRAGSDVIKSAIAWAVNEEAKQ